jgi:hypothetical protein
MLKATVAAIAVVAVAAGCAAPARAPAAPASYAYVLIGPDGAAVARAITSSAACPAIDVDGAAQPMSLRASAATIPQRPSVTPAALSKPAAFPVTTCELALPRGTRRVAYAGRDLPLPKAEPRRIVVVGDTGCRILGPVSAQHCSDPKRWPFERVARAAAATAPDLVVHVGDYHYRESPCPPQAEGCAGSPWGYGWDAWEADLFAPAQALFAAAPWVVVRGNHETCSRAGQGWWRFLDPRPPARGQDCNLAADDATGDVSEPYAVPIGGAAKIVVFDSASVGNAPIPRDGALFRTYREQMQRALAPRPPTPTWLAVHHPPLAFAANPQQPAAPYPGNAGLQSVLDSLHGQAYFPADVQAVLSGHNHLFEMVSFASDHPAQFVSGNGGDAVDDPFPVPFPPGLVPAPGTRMSEIVGTNRFGFLVMERDGAAWIVRALDADGAQLTSCRLDARSARCTPITAPWTPPPT